jgi:hypothetical protein
VEAGTFLSPLSISGIGEFHRVVVDQTLYATYSGGIMLDLVEFGDITTKLVPEPPAIGFIVLGIAWMTLRRRRS